MFCYINNIKVNLSLLLAFIRLPYPHCIMRTTFLFVFALLACTSVALEDVRSSRIRPTCGWCTTSKDCASSVCWEKQCGTKFAQTLKLCRDHFLHVCERFFEDQQCKSNICLNNRCGSAKSQTDGKCYGMLGRNCEICMTDSQCASEICEDNKCTSHHGGTCELLFF